MKSPKPGGPKRPRAPGPGNPTGEPPAAAPVPPDWLTASGRVAWDTLLTQGAMVAEADSYAFATTCNLAGAVAECWASGGVPPRTVLTELRRSAAAFGLAGAASRPAVTIPATPRPANPFAHGRRRVGA